MKRAMPTISSDLPLPQALIDLIESGFWPQTEQESLAQNLRCLIALEKIRAFAPEEEWIFFYRPPFSTEEKWMKHNPSLGDPMWATHEINPALTLIVGDFGLGSDAPIALDYRKDFENPRVIRLKWAQGPKWAPENNHWVEIAPSFADFVKMLFD